ILKLNSPRKDGAIVNGIYTNVLPADLYAGYALYQATPCTAQLSGTQDTISGGVSLTVDGLIDVSCINLKITGGTLDTISGSVVGWTLDFVGNSGTKTILQPPSVPPARGVILVQ